MFKKFIGITLSVAILVASTTLSVYADFDNAKIVEKFDNITLHKPAGLTEEWDSSNISYSGSSITFSDIAEKPDDYKAIAGIYPALSEEDKSKVKFTHFSFEQTIATSDTSIKFKFCGESETFAFEMFSDNGKLAVKVANAYPDIVTTSANFTEKNKIDWIFEQATYPVDRAFQYLYINNELVSEGIAEGTDASSAADILIRMKNSTAFGISKVLWENLSVTFYSSDITLDDFAGEFAQKQGYGTHFSNIGFKSSQDGFTVHGQAETKDGFSAYPSVVALYSNSGKLLDVGICGGSENISETKTFAKNYGGDSPDTAKMLVFDKSSSELIEKDLSIPKTFDSTPIYLLAIGNSFAMDSLSKLKNIAKSDGVNIEPYTANHSGRPLSGHYESLTEDRADYQIRPGGSGVTNNKVSMKDFIGMYDWDYVTLQGTTHYSAYDSGLFGDDAELMWTAIKDAVSKGAPNAKRLVHATWTPINELSGRISDELFADGLPDASGAYLKKLLERNKLGAEIYSTETDKNGEKALIPTLVAVDYLIRHYGFKEYGGELDETSTYDNSENTVCVYRDKTCHLTDNVGRVLAGLVWYEMLTGIPATESNYTRSTLSDENMGKIKAAAHYACENYMTYNPDNIN